MRGFGVLGSICGVRRFTRVLQEMDAIAAHSCDFLGSADWIFRMGLSPDTHGKSFQSPGWAKRL